MTTNECKTIRCEIDEADLDRQLSVGTTDHLRTCVECRTFQSEHRTLQGLMASLDTVAAPSDFDFRLRARLAREKSRKAVRNSSFSFVTRAIAAVALVSVLAVAGVVVKNWLTSRDAGTTLVSSPAPERGSGKGSEPTKLAPSTSEAFTPKVPDDNEGSGNRVGPTPRHPAGTLKNNAPRSSSTMARKNRGTAIRDSAVSPAAVLTRDTQTDPGSLVLVPLDARALKISIDNGRGTSRTISLPKVSFGSQRLMARESSLTPVSPAKGVW